MAPTFSGPPAAVTARFTLRSCSGEFPKMASSSDVRMRRLSVSKKRSAMSPTALVVLISAYVRPAASCHGSGEGFGLGGHTHEYGIEVVELPQARLYVQIAAEHVIRAAGVPTIPGASRRIVEAGSRSASRRTRSAACSSALGNPIPPSVCTTLS